MFGIIALTCITVFAFYSSIVNNLDDKYGKKHFKDETTHTYLDHDGVSRDLKTNKYRSVYTDNKGDRHMWGKDIGDINLSQIDRKREYLKYQSNPQRYRTTIYWAPSPYYKEGKPIIMGKRYKDLKTGRLLVVRANKHLNYYVDLQSLMVLRYTDSTTRMLKESGRYSKETEEVNVKEFQQLINEQRYSDSYVRDPTYGKTICYSEMEDFWLPEKTQY